MEQQNSVVVQIKHAKLASAEEIIMEYLDNPDNKMITNRVARGLTGIRSKNSMKNVLLRLRDRGLIRQVPGKSGFASAWRRPKPTGERKVLLNEASLPRAVGVDFSLDNIPT